MEQIELPKRMRDGRIVDVARLRPSDVDIRECAQILARLYRYQGALTVNYSVAQHSVFVSTILQVNRGMGKDDKRLLQMALLHDIDEAFIGDLHGPLKRWLGEKTGVKLRELEARTKRVIFRALGVEALLDTRKPEIAHMWRAVKAADNLAQDYEVLNYAKKPDTSPRTRAYWPSRQCPPWASQFLRDVWCPTTGNLHFLHALQYLGLV